MPSSKAGFQRWVGGPLIPENAEIQTYKVPEVGKIDRPSYSQIKESFDTTDLKKDSRFHLSEYVSQQLSVEEEEEARFEARVSEELAKRVEEIKAKAEEEGFVKGQSEGESKAYSELKAKLSAEIEQSKQLLEDIEKAKLNLGNQYQKQMLDAALGLASILSHYEITKAPELVSHTIEEMLERIAKKDDVVIRVSRDYANTVDQIKEELNKPKNADRRIQFELEASLKPGDVVVESMSGEVASFFDEKLSLLRAKLMQNFENTAKLGDGGDSLV